MITYVRTWPPSGEKHDGIEMYGSITVVADNTEGRETSIVPVCLEPELLAQCTAFVRNEQGKIKPTEDGWVYKAKGFRWNHK